MNDSNSADLAQSISTALQAMRDSRPKDAEAICRDWLSANPGCAHHLRLLGHALMKQKRLDEAEEKIRFAMDLEPDFPQLYEDLGSILALRGDYEGAIPCFEIAIQREPSLPGPYRKMADAPTDLSAVPEAIRKAGL